MYLIYRRELTWRDFIFSSVSKQIRFIWILPQTRLRYPILDRIESEDSILPCGVPVQISLISLSSFHSALVLLETLLNAAEISRYTKTAYSLYIYLLEPFRRWILVYEVKSLRTCLLCMRFALWSNLPEALRRWYTRSRFFKRFLQKEG